MAYGSSNIVLALYLKEIGVLESQIGIFMACTLIGDTFLSYWMTWYADHLGRRRIIRLGCLLMIFSGVVFSTCGNFYWLLFAAIVGVISPSGDEVGPFKSIEESSMAHLTALKDRADVYALHWLLATAGSATGSLFTGLLVTHLTDGYGYSRVDAYRSIFIIYSIIGVVKLVISLLLSDACEIHNDQEQQSLLPRQNKPLQRETVSILIKLCSVFMLDSLGSGFLTQAWAVYYFKTHFLISSATLGVLFFITNICNSLSALPSSKLAKMFGPIKATLLVQVPSAIFLILTPFMKTFLSAAFIMTLFYTTSAMDVVPRQVLLTALIQPEELTKVMGIVNIGKTLARCVGPVITGALAGKGLLWISFVISGALILCADGLLTLLFFGIDRRILDTHS